VKAIVVSIVAMLLALFASACTVETGEPAHAVAQVDQENCDTVIEESPGDCDASHAMVMRCGKLGLGEAQPSALCAPGPGQYGSVWCCEPSFAETCGDLCQENK
jgi:hypothetical protein